MRNLIILLSASNNVHIVVLGALRPSVVGMVNAIEML